MRISKILSLCNNRDWKKELIEVEVMFLVGRRDMNIHCIEHIQFYVEGE